MPKLCQLPLRLWSKNVNESHKSQFLTNNLKLNNVMLSNLPCLSLSFIIRVICAQLYHKGPLSILLNPTSFCLACLKAVNTKGNTKLWHY